MKKHYMFFAIFLLVFTFGQEKKIEFTKELNYTSYSTNIGNKPSPTFKLLSSNKGEFLTSLEMNYLPIHLFSNEIGIIPVKLGFNNILTSSMFVNYFFFGSIYNKSDKKPSEVTVKNLNSKETILGISCNNYLLSYPYGNPEYDPSDEIATEKIKICIDEKNAINNVPVVSSIINELSNAKLSNSNLKGLVLKVGPGESKTDDYIIIKSIKDTQNYAFFDQRKAMMQQQRTADSLLVERIKYESEFNSEHEMADSMQVAIMDSAYIDEGLSVEKYVSTYKKKPEEGSYAIDNLPNKRMWEMLPTHCTDLNKNLPILEDKNFATHLKNLTGQLCDLYLTQSESHNVAIKITIDEIRREFLFINAEKEKLNKSDQKKVNQYLEKLD